MSATRTFVPITTAFISGSKFGFQSAEKMRQADDVANYIGDHLPLGGDEVAGHVTGAATWEAVDATKVYSINGDSLGGMTLDVVFFSKTENAAQAVQVRLRNTTDSSNAALSTSITATTMTAETVSATLASGVKSYRLEVLGGVTYAVFGAAFLRIRKVPT